MRSSQFVGTFITAIGVAQSYCWESPKPTEFATTGQYWSDVCWKMRVRFQQLHKLLIQTQVSAKTNWDFCDLPPTASSSWKPGRALKCISNSDGSRTAFIKINDPTALTFPHLQDSGLGPGMKRTQSVPNIGIVELLD
jgi:hypothetical protein